MSSKTLFIILLIGVPIVLVVLAAIDFVCEWNRRADD